MAPPRRILIVGGGIGGLTLANALCQQADSPELVERGPVWHAEGGGILVHANGMRMLPTLGMGAGVEHAGTVVRRLEFGDQWGTVLCETDLGTLWGDVGLCIGVERTALQQVLVTGAGVRRRLGTAVTSLIQNDHHVSVGFSDRSSGEYDIVVGADGISSTVRAFTLNAATPAYLGQMGWRGIAPIRPRGLTAVQFPLGDGCFFGLCPVGGGRTYVFGNVTEPRFHDALHGRLERVRDRFASFGGPVRQCLAALEHDEQVHCSPIEWVSVDQWHIGRVVLIGDAAHASSPMGQGACMAMEDACVLAEELRHADTVRGALSGYVHRRRPRVEWVQHESLATSESFRLPPAVRNAALRERGDEVLRRRFGPLVAAP